MCVCVRVVCVCVCVCVCGVRAACVSEEALVLQQPWTRPAVTSGDE